MHTEERDPCLFGGSLFCFGQFSINRSQSAGCLAYLEFLAFLDGPPALTAGGLEALNHSESLTTTAGRFDGIIGRHSCFCFALFFGYESLKVLSRHWAPEGDGASCMALKPGEVGVVTLVVVW